MRSNSGRQACIHEIGTEDRQDIVKQHDDVATVGRRPFVGAHGAGMGPERPADVETIRPPERAARPDRRLAQQGAQAAKLETNVFARGPPGLARESDRRSAAKEAAHLRENGVGAGGRIGEQRRKIDLRAVEAGEDVRGSGRVANRGANDFDLDALYPGQRRADRSVGRHVREVEMEGHPAQSRAIGRFATGSLVARPIRPSASRSRT